MESPLSAEEALLYTTVSLEVTLANGAVSCGTGFIFLFAEQAGSSIPAIVTNKHVVRDGKRALIYAHTRTEDGRLADHSRIELEWRDRWIDHPDPAIDLCVFPITGLTESSNKQGRPLFFRALSKSIFPVAGGTGADAISPVEEILMVGYPNGLRDGVHNFPIVRRGLTATDPRLNYNGKPEFLIDAACYPGSSGSPVFLYNRYGFYSPPGGGLLGGKKLTFLGVLYAGPIYTAAGRLEVVEIPTALGPVPRVDVPMNLGNVIHARTLSDFEPIFDRLLKSDPGAIESTSTIR